MTSATVTFLPEVRWARHIAELAGGEDDSPRASRVAPLLLVRHLGDGTHDLCVGDVMVTADADAVTYTVNVAARWQSRPAGIDEDASHDATGVAEYLTEMIDDVLPAAARVDDVTHTAARYAKAACEVARNHVVELRELRYTLEQHMAAESLGHTANEHLTGLVSSLLLLDIVCGRAEDRARDAIREGLWAYLDDDEAYHAYRLLRDPTILSDAEPATTRTRTWMRLHDSAIRQCEAMAEQRSAESSAVIDLLAAAVSISGSRDADAQTRLNLLIALVSLGIGVPALILALYGATALLPLETPRQNLAFAPVAAPLVVAGGLAIFFAPKGSTKHIWRVAGIAVIVVAVLLYLAGITLEKAV